MMVQFFAQQRDEEKCRASLGQRAESLTGLPESERQAPEDCRLHGMASGAGRRGHTATYKARLDIQASPLKAIAGTGLDSSRKMDRP